MREHSGGRRPSVDVQDATVPLSLYLHFDEARLYRSLGRSESLHKRGYRSEGVHKGEWLSG